jgi:putative FmdB family regulatory protein
VDIPNRGGGAYTLWESRTRRCGPLPTYEYRCADCNHQFERFQKMSDDPVTECEKCGGAVQRILFPVAIHFKGSGFYTTDYARKKNIAASSNGGGSNGSSGSSSETKADGEGVKAESAKSTEGAKTEGAKKADTVSTSAASKD